MKRFSRGLTTVLAVIGLTVGPQFASAASASTYPACTISGTIASEILTGTAGNDVICTGGGDDVINADAGNDIVIVQNGGNVTANLGSGNDTFDGTDAYSATVDGGTGDDYIIGSNGNDSLNGGIGVDPDTDTIDAGMGDDTIHGSNLETLIVDLGPGNDYYYGGLAYGATVNGGAGDDELQGSAGVDTLNGGDGADTIYGAAGNDSLVGGAGIDDITGGNGNDNLQGDSGNDTLAGDAGDDILNGGDGTDDLQGGEGDDTLIGGEAADLMMGGPGTDNLAGGAGNDSLYGEAGVDDLSGDLGTDIIAGGDGVDELDGGFDLAYCDYTATEPIQTTCIYDDKAPTFPSFNLSAHSVDVGTSAQTFVISGTVTDVTGVRELHINCGPLMAAWYGGNLAYVFDGHEHSTSTNSSFTVVTNQDDKDVNFSIEMKVALGLKPGQFNCSAYAVDVLSQSSSLPSSAGQLDFAVVRSGTFDDEAPEWGTVTLSKHEVESGLEDQTFVVSGRLTDATGIAKVHLVCGPAYFIWYMDGTLWRHDGVDGYAGYENARVDVSDGGKVVDFSVTLRIPYGTAPGEWTCWGDALDTLNNYQYGLKQTGGLDFKITRTGPGADRDGDGKPDGFDDAGPTYSNFDMTKHVVDVGAFRDTFIISGRVSDPSGIRSLNINCGPTLMIWHKNVMMYRTDGHNTGSFGTENSSVIQQATYIDFAITMTVAFGVQPSTGYCSVSATDNLNHTSYGDSVELGLDFEIMRTPPGQPTAPNYVRYTPETPTAGVLEWTPPAFMGNPELKDYQIEYSLDKTTWTRIRDGFSVTPRLPLSNLKSNTKYWFKVRGENGGGYGTWSEPTLIETPKPYAPDAPTDLLLSGLTSTSIVLDWRTPRYNGGSPITDYLIEVSSDGGTTWREVPHPAANSIHFSIFGLAPGTDYLVRVAAVNIAGRSDRMQSSFTTLKSVASAPEGLSQANVDLTTLTLNWNLPATNGGDDITDYVVEVSSDGGTNWTAIAHTPSPVRSFNVNNLTKGKAYKFRVSAVNSLGTGAPSAVLSLTMGVTVPSAPRTLVIGTVTSTTAALTWTPPTTNGGATISDYLVETSRDGGTIWNAVPHTASANPKLDVTGLAPGISYLVRISAKNSAGYSESISGSFTTLLKVASAPSLISARDVSDTTLTLGWQLPASNGGAAITDYTVQVSSNLGVTWTSIAHDPVNLRTFAVTALQAGTTYQFRVAAVTSVGPGAWSPVTTVTTLGYTPNAPTGLTVSSKTTSTITLKWVKATVTGGSAVRSYMIQYSKNNGSTWTTVTSKVKVTGVSLVVSGLKSKTTYLFRVIALNDVGASAPSKSFKVVTK